MTRWSNTIPHLRPWDEVREETSSYYASGYAKARPGNPVADTGQFLIELRDLPQVPFRGAAQRYASLARRTGGVFSTLPKLMLGELENFKNLGSEYLNVVFGWKPFVNDLRKMYNLWKEVDKRMAQIVRENGRNIRRKAQVAYDAGTDKEPQVYYPWAFAQMVGGPPNWMNDCGSLYDVETRWDRRVWFSGSFRYFIPDTGSSQWDARARAALFGALPTPELLWNVLPWTWLIDWFSNVGDVVSNLSVNALDNLVTNYSYIMMQYNWEKRCTVQTWHGYVPEGTYLPLKSGWNAYAGSFTSREGYVTKSRVGGGNPFGLNVKLEDLSPYQLGILAALGLSRGSVT